MAIPVFPGSALLEHQHAHLEAILKGELQPVRIDMNEDDHPIPPPPKMAHFLATAQRANFQLYALNRCGLEPNVFILFLPEEDQRKPNGTLDCAIGLFGEMYECSMMLFDFYLASRGAGNDIHPWQWEALRRFKPQFQHKRVHPIRAADHELRATEAQALKDLRLPDYLAAQLERLHDFAEHMKNRQDGKTAFALMSLHHGCNPAFFDYLDMRDVSYCAVVPRYEKHPEEEPAAPAQLVYTTILYYVEWLFAARQFDKIQTILRDRGVAEEPISTSYRGSNEVGYERINRSTQIYALPEGGVVSVELLHMRGKEGNVADRRALLTVSVPAAQHTLAEKLGLYVHTI